MPLPHPFLRWLKVFGDESLFCLMTRVTGNCPETWRLEDDSPR